MSKLSTSNVNWLFFAALLLLILATGYFLARGPYRQATGTTADFSLLYTGSAAWAAGENPYDSAVLDRTLAQRGGDGWSGYQIALPSTFLMLSPIGRLPWQAAHWLWFLVNVAAVLAIFVLLVHKLALDWRNPGHLCAMALLIALGPFQTCMAVGQVSIVCVLFLLLAWLNQRRNRPVIAGVLLALAVALKPTIAGLFLIYWAVAGNWRLALVCVVCLAILCFAAVLQLASVEWFASWQGNMHMFTSGGAGDPHQFNNMMHLEFGLARLFTSDMAIRLLTWAICAIPFIFILWRSRQSHTFINELLDLALLAVISLLVVYHRFYDAVLLIFVWAWAVQAIRQGCRTGWLGIALLLPMLVNGTAVVGILQQRGAIPPWVQDGWFWQMLVVPHVTWVVLLMMIWLMYVAWTKSCDAMNSNG